MSVRRDDTSYFHEASLRRGLDTVLAANRVLLVGPGEESTSICLAGGISATTAQGTVALLEEQDVTRLHLHEAGIRVPRFRVFRFTDELASVAPVVEALGYPVGLRPAWRNRRVALVSGPGELDDAIETLRSLAGRLSNRQGRPQSRYMAEEAVGARSAQFLVAHGEVIASKATSGSGPGVDSDHTDLGQLAVRAVTAIPGLNVGTVQVRVGESDGGRASHNGGLVAWVSAAPRIASFERRRHRGESIADALLALELKHAGMRLGVSRATCAVSVTLCGLPDVKQAEAVVTDHVNATSELDVARLDAMGDRDLEMRVSAAPRALADFGDAVIRGEFAAIRPLRVEIRHQRGGTSLV